jgi:outer membrane protein assembly factor BamD
MMVRRVVSMSAVAAALVLMLGGCRHRYDNPISKKTDQPDKQLFDKAIDDLEHNRFEVARMEFTTLINAYDSSEYLAKAKLGLADSWFRQGDAHGLAEAEAEYKDFILFYPTMEEAAEAQSKICDIHYDQMEKADRDSQHTIRAEQECKQVLIQFPNSKFAPGVEQKLRNIQQNLADGEMKVAKFYLTKGSLFPAANRLQTLVDNYPLYSDAPLALWYAAQAYGTLGDRWEHQEAALLSKLVHDYPLSPYDESAKERLKELKVPIPEADPVAEARMKYEQENRGHISLLSRFFGAFSQGPNLAYAAKSGTPTMEPMRPEIPANVPAVAAGALGTSGDITVSVPADASALDANPDARTAATPAGNAASAAAAPATNPALPAAAAQTPGDINPAANAAQPAPRQNAGAKTRKRPKISSKPTKAPKKPKGQPASAAPLPSAAAPKQ